MEQLQVAMQVLDRFDAIGAAWESGQDAPEELTRLLPALDVWLDVPFAEIHHAVHILPTLERLYPGMTKFKPGWYFDVIWGNRGIITMIQTGKKAAEIIATFEAGERAFAERRKPFLLYKE